MSDQMPAIDVYTPVVIDVLPPLMRRLDLMSEGDLAILCRVEASTLEAWRKRGKGPAYALLGNQYVYRLSDVHAWIDGRVRERREPLGGSML